MKLNQINVDVEHEEKLSGTFFSLHIGGELLRKFD